MIPSCLDLLSPAGARSRLSILILHRVLPFRDELFPTEIDAGQFDRICGWLKRWLNVLPLDDAAALLRIGRLPSRALAITFDDGYADNHDVALPVLRRHGLTATFFISTGFLDGGRMWNDTVIEAVRRSAVATLRLDGLPEGDLGSFPLPSFLARRQAIDEIIARTKYLPPDRRATQVRAVAERAAASLPADLMMRSEQVNALSRAGMQIGAHTVSHPILAGLSSEAAAAEIFGSKRTLEKLIGRRVSMFAYPNGRPGRDYDSTTIAAVNRAGFDIAVTTARGAAMTDSDPLQLPRFTPWDRTPMRFAARLGVNLWKGRDVHGQQIEWQP